MIKVAKEKLEKKKQEKAKKLADYEEGKKKRRAAAKRRAGDDWDSDAYEDDTKPPVFSDDEAEVQAPKLVAKKGSVKARRQLRVRLRKQQTPETISRRNSIG